MLDTTIKNVLFQTRTETDNKKYLKFMHSSVNLLKHSEMACTNINSGIQFPLKDVTFILYFPPGKLIESETC